MEIIKIYLYLAHGKCLEDSQSKVFSKCYLQELQTSKTSKRIVRNPNLVKFANPHSHLKIRVTAGSDDHGFLLYSLL